MEKITQKQQVIEMLRRGVKGQESDIYMIQNLKYKQQDIIRIIFR